MRIPRRLRGLLAIAVSMACSATSLSARADDALTVEQAIQEARKSNAQLPMFGFDVAIARERTREAKARRWLKISLEAGLRYAPRGSYGGGSYGGDVNSENLQAVLTQPLYAGGALDAQARASEEELASRAASYRVAESDLDLDVRTHFARYLELTASLALRHEGLDRIENFARYLEQRRAAGQPVTADVLKARARQFSESADAKALERQLAEVSLELNDLLGRDPGRSLTLAPLGEPQSPRPASRTASPPWRSTADVQEAASNVRAASAHVDVVRAGGKPQVDLIVDAGLLGAGLHGSPSWATPGDRVRNDAGVSAAISLSWVVFDLGVVSAQVAQARFAGRQSAQALVVAERHAHVEWARANLLLDGAFDELKVRANGVPVAHDAYLEAESVYRGGAGTALEVLDAYSNWVLAADAYEAALFEYRSAQARIARWSSQ